MTEPAVSPTILAAIGGIVVTIMSTVAGFYVRVTNMRFKKIEKELDAKQFKDLCSLEHGHVREKLDNLDKKMEKSVASDTLILQTLAKLEQKICNQNGK
jgi:hypothetical protein